MCLLIVGGGGRACGGHVESGLDECLIFVSHTRSLVSWYPWNGWTGFLFSENRRVEGIR